MLRILFFFFFVVESVSAWADRQLVIDSSREYSITAACVVFADTSNAFTLEQVETAYLQNSFSLIVDSSAKIAHHCSYWLRCEFFNKLPNSLLWMLCFNSQISHIEVFCRSGNDTVALSELKPERSIAINNITRNKLLVPLYYNQRTTLYIHVYNQILINADISNITVYPKEKYVPRLSMHGFLVGLTFGGYIIMFVFSLFVCITQRRREFIYYSLYVFCNAVFALFGSFITDKYIFAHNPWQAFNLHASIIIGHVFYIIFVRLFIDPENIPQKVDKYLFKPLIVFIAVTNTSIALLLFVDADVFKTLLDFSLLLNAAFGIVLVLVLFRIKLKIVRLVLIGSSVMILFGVVGQLVDMFDLIQENYFYNVGVLIELFFFSYAINYKQKLITEEKQQREIDLAIVRNELDSKHRELTQKAMHIAQQEQVLNGLRQQLELIKKEVELPMPTLQKTIADVEMYIRQNSWDDFEKYFTEVYPDFYKKLLQQYPDLSQTELRVSALLKLGLNTKEIAAISGKTPKSIDITRNRIRQKLGLQREDNLFVVLTQV